MTGANRGLGSFYVDALVAAGASKVYAGARTPSSVKNSHAVPIELDITNIAQVEAAASTCRDVTLLINNAGILMNSPMLVENSPSAMRKEFDVNVFGTLNMISAFTNPCRQWRPGDREHVIDHELDHLAVYRHV
ncbi:hypothetical protein AA101099_1909 [Neoasaia chiangmaiensis NBRC 101099]|nr:SDR family NAD(P)-dependent oxidoreductase [Neoasaia chiangmaiensis]GBR39990.1 hypothetical protein AA101099_1909 [Neoasaia chiangmaiensis NBRC 101099]